MARKRPNKTPTPQLAVNQQLFANHLASQFSRMFSGYFGGDTKHENLYCDFGWPEKLDFSHFYQMYQRNGLAYAGIVRPVETCWQEYPYLQEREESHDTTPLEAEIDARFDELNFWSVLAQAHEYSRIGEYAGVIFRFADGKQLSEPVDATSLGLEGLVEVIPCMQGQLKPSDWHGDVTDTINYGKIKMWAYNEAGVTDDAANPKMRNAKIHPDRVHVFSKNSSIFGKPALESGFNDLLTIQKINGAGGEGFWKNAKAAPWLEMEKDLSMTKLAQSLGLAGNQIDQVPDKLDEVIGGWQKGYDQSLMLQGMKANFNSIRLDDPEQHRQGPLQSYAASLSIPLKILLGSQSGERASTEDAKEWAKTCNAINTKLVKPNIRRIIRDKLVRYGVIPDRPWYLLWSDLTESSVQEKFAIAKDMAEINAKNRGSGEPITYTANEIRETTGWTVQEEEIIPRGPDDETD